MNMVCAVCERVEFDSLVMASTANALNNIYDDDDKMLKRKQKKADSHTHTHRIQLCVVKMAAAKTKRDCEKHILWH